MADEKGIEDSGALLKVAEKHPVIAGISTLAAAAVALTILFAMLRVVLWPQDTILDKLGDPAYARGVITFLFALGTIGIALALTSAALLRDGDAEEAGKRFDRGKDVLTILVGILGAIIGFYFQSADTTGQSELNMVRPRIAESEPLGGTDATLSAFVSGGRGPYTYSLTFEPELPGEWSGIESSDGFILQKITLPEVSGEQTLSVTISVEDASGLEAEAKMEIPIKKPETSNAAEPGV